MILAFSIAIASGITFATKRAAPSSVRSDLRFPEIYEYRLLVMALAFSVLLVLVAHALYEDEQYTGETYDRRRRLLLARVSAPLVFLLSIVVIWVIWFVGDQGRQSPVGITFGNSLDIRVNDFLYRRAGNYTLAIACLTTTLPVLGMIVSALSCLGIASPVLSQRRGTVYVNHGPLRRARPLAPKPRPTQQPRIKWPGSCFCVVCLLLALVELIMPFYIRTLAIEDGQGQTSETEVGFGQILACFTWFPVLFILVFGVEFPGVDEARAEAQKLTLFN
ncbi:hypothetical protein PG994_000929 [Apiospora phragmitis]|uniref:Uncharacterized protein n=1 Tax=Apiospora phragmitis TaxID=2905665 RepID=A0ABR1WS63_9PEZI